ncbi:MAG: phosphatidylserine decarboxylase [Bacteroidetes bacterium GWE2_29_8]|nr:MAG: phosphatidylserine decarboxylase [Bacteroidetes bacterium GWE2_29_8]OFY15641.1 MAG: phosphatidylserine decarboxylase [Bacteroidetes bacterium GWF2_29_10]
MKIHREGYTTIIFSIVMLIMLNIATYSFINKELVKYIVYIVSMLMLIFIVLFFRYPLLDVESKSYNILSPADGKVVTIEEVFVDEFLNEKRIQVSIFMSPLNVHINRAPIGGVIKYVKYHPGKYLVAWHPKSSTENERTSILIENKEYNFSIFVRQIAGAVARRIVYYANEGDEIKQGSEIGFIKFGSRVDLLLPLGTKILVEINEKVKGGITNIGIIENC